MGKVLPFRFQQCFGAFPCYLLKGPLKPGFLDIYLTRSFPFHKFKNTSPMRVIFFLKIFKIKCKVRKCKKKLRKYFSFLR